MSVGPLNSVTPNAGPLNHGVLAVAVRVDEVAEAVRHLRYPPAGDRGVATYNRACRFGLDPGALDRANAEVLGVVQVESATAVGDADQSAPSSAGLTPHPSRSDRTGRPP